MGRKLVLGLYVLYQSSKDDYLAREVSSSDGWFSSWCSHPAKAKRFATLHQAKFAALRISKQKGYNLHVCKLVETESQYVVESLIEVGFLEVEDVSTE